MEKVKTATVTWINYNNCGTYLQAYALQHVVLSLGYENHILNDAPHFIDPHPVWRKALSWLWHKLVARPPKVMRRVNECSSAIAAPTVYAQTAFSKQIGCVERTI